MKHIDRYLAVVEIVKCLEKVDFLTLAFIDFLYSKNGRWKGYAKDISKDLYGHIIGKWGVLCRDGLTCDITNPYRIARAIRRKIAALNFIFESVAYISYGRRKFRFEGTRSVPYSRELRIAIECEIRSRVCFGYSVCGQRIAFLSCFR